MFCPNCLHEKTKVTGTTNDAVVERYRTCSKCGYGFMTIEGLKADPSWKKYAEYSDEEIAFFLKKRHGSKKQGEMF